MRRKEDCESLKASKDQMLSYLIEMHLEAASLTPILPFSNFGLLNKCTFKMPFGIYSK